MAKKKTGTTKRYSAKKTAGQKKSRTSRIRRIVFAVVVLLAVLATIFFLMLRSGGQISIFENALGSLITPVQNAFNTAASKVKAVVTEWKSYGTLKADYEALSFENEQLRMELVNAEESMQELERLKEEMGAMDTYESLDPIYAKVIARDAGPWFKTFSLNRGSNHGVSAGMAVVNGDGLIGRVYEVGLNYAKVITIIDTRSAVACLMQRTRDNGVMRGQISDSDSAANCYVYYLPNVNSITPGDTVVTSGTDSLYPKGLKIGSVTALSLDAGSEGTYAVVTPSVDFQRIEEVFILRTVIETDQDYLEPITTPKAEYKQQSNATPKPGTTPTPEPTAENPIWSYPTAIPETEQTVYNDFKVGNMVEDTWADTAFNFND